MKKNFKPTCSCVGPSTFRQMFKAFENAFSDSSSNPISRVYVPYSVNTKPYNVMLEIKSEGIYRKIAESNDSLENFSFALQNQYHTV